ncbi:hypothetical protein E4T42_08781 [Aureobasidium subglaciale]|nr:hypothetical protein E4T42_08781 [Aureobasidium subglaciale]
MDHYEPSSRPQRTYPQRDRPPPPSYHDAPPPPSGPRSDMFQFRGAAGRPAGDNYRPNDRPSGRRDNFNFSAGNNAPSFAPSDNYPGARRAPRDSRRGGQRNARGRGGPRRFGPKPAHERDLMRRQREPTPDQLEGMNEGKESRFKILDDLSDDDGNESDDSAMDLEADAHDPTDASAPPSFSNNASHSDDDDSEDEHPRAKRARVKSKSPESEQAKPKWSNPDPYTVLPPPGESDAKKKDVVKLIRKAKVEAAKPAASAAEGEDFISLNFDDDFAQDNSDDEGGISLNGSVRDEPSLPHKPSFSHLDHLHPDRNLAPPPPAEQPKGVNMSAPMSLPRLDVWPPPADVHGDPSGRSQYHTGMQRQEAKDAAAPVRKENNKKRKRRDDTHVGDIVDEWRAPVDTDPAPWFANKLQGARAEQWLHNEILDFYNYVKPRDFENQVREDLVKRMENAVKKTFPDLNIRAFGSFASGLYLPTADMDLVACSSRFLNGGPESIACTRNWMYKFVACLKRAGIVVDSSVTVISQARVPLVKFVERATGLRVDVSFENDSGLLANKTFQAWKQQYPAMPIIVSLIKQFLVMRDFSEVFSGGLGGYSVICLTITVLRVLEERLGRDWDPMESLDTVLMTFFVHFGRDFNIEKHGIQMEPWNVVSKKSWRNAKGQPSKPDRLLIIDPNNFNNDISGGSGSVLKIFDKFADAFKELNICMSDAEDTHRENGDVISILERVWGGNYALFEAQRSRLISVWQQNMASGSNFPRGNNNNQSGNSHGGGYQGKPGNPPPGNQGNQSNQPKQGKRPADDESKSNKKQKTSSDNEKKRPPLHMEYDDPMEEVTAAVSGPAGAAGQRKKSSDATAGAPGSKILPDQPLASIEGSKSRRSRTSRKEKNATVKEDSKTSESKTDEQKRTEKDRAESFKRNHPSVKDLPDRMDKETFKKLTQIHSGKSKDVAKPKHKKRKHN